MPEYTEFLHQIDTFAEFLELPDEPLTADSLDMAEFWVNIDAND